MKTKIETILLNHKKIREETIAREFLGPLNDFQRVEKLKNKLCDYVSQTFTSAYDHIAEINPITLEGSVKNVNLLYDQLAKTIRSIDPLINHGINNSVFPERRKKIIDTAEKILRAYWQTIQILELSLKIASLKKQFQTVDYSSIKHELADNQNKLSELIKESERIVVDLREKSTYKLIGESLNDFTTLADSHKKSEYAWFVTLCISCALIAIASIFAIFLVQEYDQSKGIIGYLPKITTNLILIGIPSILLKISLSKYNSEKTLKVIYNHRSAVLNQYRNFENAIGENELSKNQFRLEIFKYIFSDPKVSYSKESSSSDISLNPILNIFEKIKT
ncbi:hypothetical protein HGB47_20715 [Leptospira yasudae]|uniref:hypothetical protein n=1 Tax=Leptospira yasudae TaxID=2202201 RepID=UPI001C4FB7CB|nr:hypothetical protein [Leptospira yasudae]MBW0436033.1 hypothetical protein [Leptospira yasudae]